MNKTKTNTKFDWQIVLFFAIAYAIAWSIAFTFGIEEHVVRSNYSPLVAALVIYVPKFAFSISGVILFALNGELKTLWQRLINFRVNIKWYVIAYFGPALLYFVSALLSYTLSDNGALTPLFPNNTVWMLTFASQSGIFFYFLFRGGMGEELGLRGFAVPRLQQRFSPLQTALIIGILWGLWHVPAWADQSMIEIVILMLAVIAFSIIFTFFYNKTTSLPVVMLMHAAINSFDDVYENIFPVLLEQDWELLYIGLILLSGIILAFFINRTKPNMQKNEVGITN